jgi:hypothetical protein
MTQYAVLLGEMMDAILAGDTSRAPALLTDKKDFPATAQLAVYAEGYRIRLAEAVESAYPALAHYLSKPAFAKLAEGFIALHPSRYFNLDKYPIAFAEHVAGNSDDGFARDLAALEGAIHDVYQREETPAMDAGWAARQTPETIAATPLPLRAASRLMAFETPVNEYLTAFRAGEKPQRPGEKKSWLLVLRHRHQVQRLPLAEAEHALLSLLAEGLTLSEALEDDRLASFAVAPDFPVSLQGWFARWIAEGVFRQPS